MWMYLLPLSSRFKMDVVANIVLFTCILCQNKTSSLESCSVHWSVTQSGRHSWFLMIFPKGAGDNLPCHFFVPEGTEDHSFHKAADHFFGDEALLYPGPDKPVLGSMHVDRAERSTPDLTDLPHTQLHRKPGEGDDSSRLCCGPHWASILLGVLTLRKSWKRWNYPAHL